MTISARHTDYDVLYLNYPIPNNIHIDFTIILTCRGYEVDARRLLSSCEGLCDFSIRSNVSFPFSILFIANQSETSVIYSLKYSGEKKEERIPRYCANKFFGHCCIDHFLIKRKSTNIWTYEYNNKKHPCIRD